MPALGRVRQRNHKFKPSLGLNIKFEISLSYIVRPWFKTKPNPKRCFENTWGKMEDKWQVSGFYSLVESLDTSPTLPDTTCSTVEVDLCLSATVFDTVTLAALVLNRSLGLSKPLKTSASRDYYDLQLR
jgi:hypothetical protein